MDRELLLLGLLRGQEMHGYQLNEILSRVNRYIGLKKATVYFLLDKMADSGWITRTDEQDGNRPPRRVYHLTPEGEMIFQQLLRENLAQHHPMQFSGDIGLAFADALPPHELKRLLTDRRAAVEAELAVLRTTDHPAGSLRWIIEHQIRHLATELDWLHELIHSL
ncbi:MAG: helix-turn-helix transcriptional regulator [Chloroflexota bacterium]